MNRIWNLAAPLLVALSGCRSSELESVYPVTGVLTFEGKLLSDATVTFHRQDGKGRNLTARTDSSGHFALTTHAPNDGAAPGRYLITVECRELVQEGDEKMRSGRNLLPARYADPETSGLHCEVHARPNELPTSNLTRSLTRGTNGNRLKKVRFQLSHCEVVFSDDSGILQGVLPPSDHERGVKRGPAPLEGDS